MRPFLTILTLAAAAGCQDERGLSFSPADADDGSAEFDPTTADEDMDADLSADLMSLDGVVRVTAGEIDLASSDLEITLFAGTVPLCSGMLVLETSQTAVLDDDVDAASAWELEVSAAQETLQDCALPPSLSIALGAVPFDPSLTPAAETAGFEASAGNLYGAVAQLAPTEPVYLFGVMGTDAQFDGDATLEPGTPVEDGAYTLETLYLLPLPPS